MTPALIDEYARVSAEITALKKRAAQLEDAIYDHAGDLADDQEYSIESNAHVVTISARARERKLDLGKLKALIGWKRYFAMSSVPLRAFDALLLTDEERKALVTESQTGPRRITVVKKYASEIHTQAHQTAV